MVKYVSAEELRAKDSTELAEELRNLRNEYQHMLQENHTNTVDREDMRMARKNIARCMHMASEKRLEGLIEKHRDNIAAGNLRLVPKALRPKTTRARRLALTEKQKNMRVRRVRVRAAKYPKKIFAYVQK